MDISFPSSGVLQAARTKAAESVQDRNNWLRDMLAPPVRLPIRKEPMQSMG
ncbi:MAG: hypothetical protein GKR90_17190 [Pseudomonadales bacterium]|nr:hypothetical protein [Pseudomonadales bacterium]